MREAVVADRKATGAEVRAHATAIRRLAHELGLAPPRMRDDGTVVIHSSEPGYQTANRISAAASSVVGAYVHVITDDVPGAVSARNL
ncbi:MAG: hypothetical protein M3450_01715 [Actinomycetota bacterium]|nr:hypothetical protein [Actinomycetota bacterium]